MATQRLIAAIGLTTILLVIVLVFYAAPTTSASPAAATAPAFAPRLIRLLMPPNDPRCTLLTNARVQVAPVANIEAALAGDIPVLTIIDASPDNLKTLAAARDTLRAFTQRGGWVMLWGLDPKGLADFNKIVGVEHIQRPFEMEEVEMPIKSDALLKGVARSDIFMETGAWSPEPVPVAMRANDAWSYVVDYDDIAPFCALPGIDYWKFTRETKPGEPHYIRNLVDGLTYQWRFGLMWEPKPASDNPNNVNKITFTFPREEEIVGVGIHPTTPNVCGVCQPIHNIQLVVGDAKPLDLAIKGDTDERQDFKVEAKKAKQLSLEVTNYGDSGNRKFVGMMNVYIKAKRSDDFYKKVKPLLNIGVLVKYPMGNGGILLNQVRMVESEAEPANLIKKQKLVGKLVANLAIAQPSAE